MAYEMQVNGPALTSPAWCNDTLGPDRLLTSGVLLSPTAFIAPDGFVVTVAGGGAAQGATSVPLASPIPVGKKIPSGTMLDFGAAKLAILTADATAGQTALAVRALPTAVVATNTATYRGILPVSVQDGTVIGRTYTERDAGTAFGPVADGDDEVTIVAFRNENVTLNPYVTVLREGAGTIIKENRLPGWSGFSADVKARLRTRFKTILGEV